MMRMLKSPTPRRACRMVGQMLGALVVGALAWLPVSASAAGACEWRAVHDWRPPAVGMLAVTGTCPMPTPGFSIVLKRKVPPGADPSVLLLEKMVTAPGGFVAQVLTPTPVLYREVTGVSISRVTILPDDHTVEVQDLK